MNADAPIRPPRLCPYRATALQQYDLGYKLFVEERLEQLKQAALQRKERPNTSLLSQASLLRPPLPSAAPSLKSLFQNQSRMSSLERRDAEQEELASSSSHKSSLFAFPTGPRSEASGVDTTPPTPNAPPGPTAMSSRASGLSFTSPPGHDQGNAGSAHFASIFSPGLTSSRNRVMFNLQSPSPDVLTLAGSMPPADDALSHAGSWGKASETDLDDSTRLASRRSMRLLSSAAGLSASTAVKSILETLDAADLAKVQQTRLFALQKVRGWGNAFWLVGRPYRSLLDVAWARSAPCLATQQDPLLPPVPA